MKLGPFEVPHPFILAPMAGITNSPFRRLMRRMGSAVMISELVSANGIEYGLRQNQGPQKISHRTLDLLRYNEEERTIGIQIFGEVEEHLCNAAKYVEEIGADFVDLNLGCPVPKVVKKGAGSALCRDPSKLGKILKAMVRSTSIPVTIKIRTGWDSNSRNAHEVVDAATDAGVAWVAIHGRTRAQGYSGEADWDYIAEVKQKASIPIIGNGDITNARIAVDRVQDYGLDGVMIGRGALRNPFIFEQAEAIWKGRDARVPDRDRYLDLLEQQRKLLDESYDETRAMLQSRKFLSWYSSGFPGSHDFRRKVFEIKERDELWDEAQTFFHRVSEGRDLSFLSQPFLMGGHG